MMNYVILITFSAEDFCFSAEIELFYAKLNPQKQKSICRTKSQGTKMVNNLMIQTSRT